MKQCLANSGRMSREKSTLGPCAAKATPAISDEHSSALVAVDMLKVYVDCVCESGHSYERAIHVEDFWCSPQSRFLRARRMRTSGIHKLHTGRWLGRARPGVAAAVNHGYCPQRQAVSLWEPENFQER